MKQRHSESTCCTGFTANLSAQPGCLTKETRGNHASSENTLFMPHTFVWHEAILRLNKSPLACRQSMAANPPDPH
eukprot:1149384-Pelagomonas_calceolata.AAC.1